MKSDQSNLPEWLKDHVPKDLLDSSLFRFEVMLQEEETVDGKTKKKKIVVDMLPGSILSYENLEQQMMDLPGQYAFFSAIYSEVRCNAETMERAIKARRGVITEQLVKQGKEGNLKFTVDQVKNVLESDEGLVKLDNKFKKLQMQCGKLYHVIEMLKMRAELARSLAGFKRQELSHS